VITCLVSGCAICYPVEVQYSVQTSSHKPSCGLPVVKGTAICNAEVWAERRICWLRAVCVAWGSRCPLILAAHKLQQGTVVTGCLNPDTVYTNTFLGCFARFYLTCSCGPVTYRVPRKSLYLHLCYLCIGCSSVLQLVTVTAVLSTAWSIRFAFCLMYIQLDVKCCVFCVRKWRQTDKSVVHVIASLVGNSRTDDL
jgi:hypothetical protein